MDDTNKPIPVAKTAGAYGVRGSVRIVPFETGEALLATSQWFLIARDETVTALHVQSVKHHGTALLAKFTGIDSKEAADALRGTIGVLRADFPPLEDGKYWAVDVVGSSVINHDSLVLGRVVGFETNGVQDILVVLTDENRQLLIPMMPAYVEEIDTDAKIVRVDWELDWS